MKKRIFTIFLVILLAVTNIGTVYATNTGAEETNAGGIENISLDDAVVDWGIDGQEWTIAGQWNEIMDTASGIIKTVMSIILWPLTFAQKMLIHSVMAIVPSMDQVVFNNGLWGNVTRLTFFDSGYGGGLLTDPHKTIAFNMQGQVSAVYQTFRYLALIGFVIAIACIAVKMIISSIGKQKQQYKDMLKNWLFALILLVVGHWIMIYMIYISAWLVDLIKTTMWTTASSLMDPGSWGNAGSLTGAFANCISDPLSVINPIQILINLIAIIVFAAMNMKIFKVYLERVIIVGVLIMLFPIVALLFAFEKAGLRRGNTFGTWLNTFVSQVFIQPVHAIAIMFIVVVLNGMMDIDIGAYNICSLPIIGPIITLMVINFVFKIEEVVKRVLAINGASMGQPMKPAAEMGRLAKGAANAGIGAFNAGRKIRMADPGGRNPALRKAAMKDIGMDYAKKWGKKAGIDIDKMGLIEAQNVGGKMKADLKKGKITPAHIPEYSSKMAASGDFYEKMAKFGFSGRYDFEAAAMAAPGTDEHTRAMLAIMNEVEPGSADKFIKRDTAGNIILDPLHGNKPAINTYMYEASLRTAANRKADIKSLAKRSFSTDTIEALQYDLQLENPEKYNEWTTALSRDSSLGITPTDINDFNFSKDVLQAMAYCQAEGLEISEVMTGRKLDMTKVAPLKSAEKTAATRKFVTEEFSSLTGDDKYRAQKIAQAYDKEDRANVDIILSRTSISRTDWDAFKSTGNIPVGQEDAFRTAFYYLDKPDAIPSGSGTAVMTDRQLRHGYYNVPENGIKSTLKGVANMGASFDSIGFDQASAEAFEVMMDKHPSLFAAALADVNAAEGTSLDESRIVTIVRQGAPGRGVTSNDIKIARLIAEKMSK